MRSKEEILLILKMVQDGKISNEDAAKLIEAIEAKDAGRSEYYHHSHKERKSSKKSFEEKMEEMAEGLENMVSDVVGSTQEAFRNFPEINPGNWFNKAEKRHFTYGAKEGMNLKLISKNGSIKLFPGEEKINVVFSIYTKKDVDDVMENIVINHSDEELFIDASGVDGGVGIEVRIPTLEYGKINISTRNGSLRCCPIKADDIELNTKNGSLKFNGAISPVVKALTKNGSITCENSNSDKAGISTSNGSITVNDSEFKLLDTNTTNGGIRCYSCKSDNISAHTSNASIIMEDCEPIGSNGIMDLKTSNGNVRIQIPKDIGAMFKAQAGRHGKVTVNLPCSINKNMEYEGKTEGYDNLERKINITARTNLGRIDIS